MGKYKHGHSINNKMSPEYATWRRIKTRCLNSNNPDWPDYGGRGIKICDRWINSFENFLNDLGLKPSMKHSIGRIDNDGDYTPENTEWQTPIQQQNNKRNNKIITFNGHTLSLQQWADRLNIKKGTLYKRIFVVHWSLEKALTSKIHKNQFG